MAEIIGEIVCGMCGDTADLKKDSRGKFYYHCGCGQHFMRGRNGAEVVLTKARIFGAEPPAPVNVTAPAPASAPKPAPAPAAIAPPPPPRRPTPAPEPKPATPATESTNKATFFG